MVACTLDSRRDALHYSASVEVYKTNDSISCTLSDKYIKRLALEVLVDV